MQRDASECNIFRWLLSRAFLRRGRHDPEVRPWGLFEVFNGFGPSHNQHVIGWCIQYSVLASWSPSDRLRLAAPKQKDQKRKYILTNSQREAHEYLFRLPSAISKTKYSLSIGRSPVPENRLNHEDFFFIFASKTTLRGKRRLSVYFPAMCDICRTIRRTYSLY